MLDDVNPCFCHVTRYIIIVNHTTKGGKNRTLSNKTFTFLISLKFYFLRTFSTTKRVMDNNQHT